MFENKLMWHAIGTTYVAIGFAVLAKRHGEVAYLTYKGAFEAQKDLIRDRMF